MISTLRRRASAREVSGELFSAPASPIPAGTMLGWFTEARHRIEVSVAGETRLWLRAWRRNRSGEFVIVNIGPITWNEFRTPCLEPVPDWLNAGPLGALPIVVKSMALLQTILDGVPVDPALQLSINPALGAHHDETGPDVRRNPSPVC